MQKQILTSCSKPPMIVLYKVSSTTTSFVSDSRGYLALLEVSTKQDLAVLSVNAHLTKQFQSHKYINKLLTKLLGGKLKPRLGEEIFCHTLLLSLENKPSGLFNINLIFILFIVMCCSFGEILCHVRNFVRSSSLVWSFNDASCRPFVSSNQCTFVMHG